MKKQFKHIIAKALLLLFLIPILSKGIDVVFHKHDDFVCTAKNVKHIHKHHDTCSISSFTFTTFLVKINAFDLSNLPVLQLDKACFYTSLKKTNTNLYFSLRAPPIV